MGNISKINTSEGLKGIATLWQSLCVCIPESRIFQTFEWNWNAWDCVLAPQGGNDLYVLVWKQDGKGDAVIFPFYLDGHGVLRFIMDEHSDYCDCVYLLSRNHHLAFKDALEFIKADKRVKQIALHKLDANSEALNYIAALAPQASVFKENTYSWIEVAPSDDFAASQSQLRSKDKANVRAIRRKAERFVLRVFSKSAGIPYPEKTISGIVDGMIRRGFRDKGFMPADMMNFCRNIYEAGVSDIVALEDNDGGVVAVNFLLKMMGRRLSWMFLYTDPHSSTELYVKYFYSGEVDEANIFDFGTGGYEYKLGTFRPCVRVLFGLSVSLDRRTTIELSYRRFVNAAKTLVKSIIRR